MNECVTLDGMRIALATDTWEPQLNGVTRTLRRLVDEARRRGADVRVYAPAAPGVRPTAGVQWFQSVPFWGYPELRLAWPGVRAMSREWTEWRPHLVHAATPFGVGLAARGAARQLQLPFATSYHTSLSQYAAFYGLGWASRPGWAFLRNFHNSGAITWCPTRAIADELRANGFTNTAMWGRGVDTAAFSPRWRSMEFRRAMGITDNDHLLVYVGRIAREKGLDRLLRALHEVRACRSNVRLMLVGDGPYEGVCRAKAPEGTVFTGTLSGHELSAAFASGDLFVFPSTTDTFGNVLLEAMASGLPVLAADCPVARERLEGGRGTLFRADIDGGLADTLLTMSARPELLREMGERALAHAQATSWPSIFDTLFSEYRALSSVALCGQTDLDVSTVEVAA